MKAFVLLIFALALTSIGYAQNAQAYFNSSANLYVKDKKVEAMQTIRDGLTKYPNDEKLKALGEKMKQEKKEQDKKDQEKKEQEKKDKEKKDQEKKDQEKKDQEKKDQEKKDQEKKDQEKKDQQEKDEEKDPEKDKSEQEKKDQQKQNAPDQKKLEDMKLTEDMAMKILEAMKNQEKQYIQGNKRKATKAKDKSKPDW
ncbi:MAG TPA: hypothetical protein PLJ60_13780 [Chryseolinea sp.]|nr:hypothetical protein [Chryseolinea sp.]